jgi:hypothetical protein
VLLAPAPNAEDIAQQLRRLGVIVEMLGDA